MNQILQLYVIMGGVPFYLSLLEPKETLVNNIDCLFFRRNGQLKTEFDELYNAIFSNPGRYIEIVRLLSENKQGMTLDEVAKKTGIDGKRLTTVLRNLERCDILMTYKQFGTRAEARYTPWRTSTPCSFIGLYRLMMVRTSNGRCTITPPEALSLGKRRVSPWCASPICRRSSVQWAYRESQPAHPLGVM